MEKDAAGCRALNRNFIVGGDSMKKLLFILAAIIYFPIGVIFALAKNYK